MNAPGPAWLTLPAARAATASGQHGALLRLARTAAGLTLHEAGRLAGYSAATLSRLERGDHLRRGIVAADLPGEGVLPAAPADDQNLHFGRFWKASLNASRAFFTMSVTWPAMLRARSP